MSTSIAPPENETDLKIHDGSVGRGHNQGDDRWGGGDSDRWGHFGPSRYGSSSQSNRLAMWLCMASITMLFAGLSSAYVFRLGISQNVFSIPMPRALIWNTLILLGSSFSLEISRKHQREAHQAAFRGWLMVTTLLGLTFLFVQLSIWRHLAFQGIYLTTSPHSSFFFLLTGVHGMHFLGGMLALGYVLVRPWHHYTTKNSGGTALDLTAMYWHFMAALWVYLFLLLFFWRY